MVLADASISFPHRAPRPRSQSPACSKSQKQSAVGPPLFSEKTKVSGTVQKAHKREVSSRYRPASTPKFSAKLSLSASADFSSSSCNSSHRAASSERGRAGFTSPVGSERNPAASDVPKRAISTERRPLVPQDTKAAPVLSSSHLLNSSSSITANNPKRAASTERRRIPQAETQATGSSSLSSDCSSSISTSSRRPSATERGRSSCQPESKSTGSFRKPSLSPRRPAWQSSNGMFSSLQADSALSMANGGSGRSEMRDQTLRPAMANGVGDHGRGHSTERKSTPARKGGTPERKGSLFQSANVDQVENARPFETVLMKSIGKRWPGTSNVRNSRSAMSKSIDFSSDKAASPPHSRANFLTQGLQANAAVARTPSRNLSRSLNEGPPSPISAMKTSPAERGSSKEGRVKEKVSIVQKSSTISLQQESLAKMKNADLQQESFAQMYNSSLRQGSLAKMQSFSVQQETLAKVRSSSSQQGNLDKVRNASMLQESLESRIGVEAQLATSIPHTNDNTTTENAGSSTASTAVSNIKYSVIAARGRSISPEGVRISSGSMCDLTSKASQAITQLGFYEAEQLSIKLSKNKDKLLQQYQAAESEKRLPSDEVEIPLNNPTLTVSPVHSQPNSSSGAQDLVPISCQEWCVRLVSPSRGGSSPARTRLPPSPKSSSNSSRQKTENNGMEIANGKRITASQIEEVRNLRLLQNRLLQWRFVNARAEAALAVQRAAAEKVLVNVGLKTFDLQMKVAMLRIKSLKARQIQKLDSLLSAQEGQLQDWETMHQEHLTALEAVTKALRSATLRIPLIGGARADVRAIREAIASVLDVMHSTELPVRSLQPKVERMTVLLGEVARICAIEIALISDLEELLSTFESFQMEERSLKAHIMQVEHELYNTHN